MKKLKTISIYCLCLLPVLWSFVVSVQASKKNTETFFHQHGVQPLSLHIHMVHLRQYDIREGKAIAKFQFHNAGSQPLTITNIKPSCGCIQVRMRKQREPISPSEAGEFYLEVDTAGETAGEHEYKVRVEYQSGAKQTSFLQAVTFRVDVPDKKITVRPRALIFYQLGSEETTQTIQLVDFRPQSSFQVVDSQTDSEYLKIGEVVTGKDKFGHFQILIPITASATVSPGKHTGSLIITTNDPEFPILRIPALINGPAE